MSRPNPNVTKALEAQGHHVKRPHKYKAQTCEVDGEKFDSRAEGRRYKRLKLLEQAGEIRGLERQPEFVLQEAFETRDGEKLRAIKYVADFKYEERQGTSARVYWLKVVEDVKGMQTPEFKIKRKLFLKRYPELELRLTK